MIVRRGIQVKTLDDWLPQLPFQGEIAGAYILSSEARLGSEMRHERKLALDPKPDVALFIPLPDAAVAALAGCAPERI